MAINHLQTSYTVVVPAAGVGSRMQADKPKQYLPLGEGTVVEQTLQRLLSHPNISDVVLVVSPEDPFISKLALAQHESVQIVTGGKERADSVLNGLLNVSGKWALVHDAARPCVRHQDISKLLRLADGNCGGILARRVTDTMKQAHPERQNEQPLTIERSVPRSHLWHALTPQFFPTQQLVDALQWCHKRGLAITDEASAIEHTQGQVALVEGASDNIKITQPGDLALAEFYLAQQHPHNHAYI